MTDLTVLRLSGIGVPPYSARGLTQTLAPIAQAAQLRRTINGALADVSAPEMRKYASTISGDDQRPPAFDTVWPGRIVTVDCIAELAVPVPEPASEESEPSEPVSEEALGRPAVEGSIRTEGDFVFYRPRLQMLVVGFSIEADEWAAGVPWSLALEEV